MTIPIPHPAEVLARWAGQIRVELTELGEDTRRIWRDHIARLRQDPDYRNALLQGALRGLLNALARGPRATILWAAALVIEIALEIVQSLQSMGREPGESGYDW